MGYKLAGFDVIGGVEIDPQMMEMYRANHHPKYSFLMGVQQFNDLPLSNIPKELFELDILDGSPPCSVFSMAGKREKKWGAEHHFKEGQAKQILDDLFFHFIETARRLQPKIVIAENVKGLIIGNAKGYVKEIFQHLSTAGYDAQLFLLNAVNMGVPQRRERTFFVARRKDLKLPKLTLSFQELEIPLKKAFIGVSDYGRDMSHTSYFPWWQKSKPFKSFNHVNPSGNGFTYYKMSADKSCSTLIANSKTIFHWETMRNFSKTEFCRIQSFPDDFDFLKNDPGYVCGMSVPPFMMQRIAHQVDIQLLSQ